jgi:hypothetical protein
VYSRRNPQERRFLPISRLLRWGIYWGPRHGARGHRWVIAWRVRAVVPHRWGDWRHFNIGCGGDPERRHVKEYPAMEVVNVPKPMWRDKRMVAKAATVEGSMCKAATMETAVAQAASVRPTVPHGIRIGDSPNEEHQSHTEYTYGLVHTCFPSVVSGYSHATIAAHLSNA